MTDHVPAAAEGLPNLTRRTLLAGFAASPAVALPAVATATPIMSVAIEAQENPALLKAWKQFRETEAEYYAAKDALEWLADEWKHRWPLAPEEILDGANANSWDDDVERDIVGRAIERDCSVLTKRLTKEFRQKNERCCFYLDQPEETAKRLAHWKSQQPKGRTPKGIERNRKWIAKTVADLEMRLRLSREYHAETKRLREASGSGAAQARLTKAKDAFDPALKAVFREKPVTTYGLRLRADAYVGYMEYLGVTSKNGFIGNAYDLAGDIIDLVPDRERVS